MLRESYKPLPQAKLDSRSCYVVDALNPPQVSLDSPAMQVMTDFRRIPAATIGYQASVADASQAMITRGVRALLVVDVEGRVAGLITATDVLGEKPVQATYARGVPRGEVYVRDVMTPLAELEVLSLDDVTRAEVGHVVATLKSSGRQHALVVEPSEEKQPFREPKPVRLRGIFSASQVARQMGITLQTAEIARTFAAIEAVVNS